MDENAVRGLLADIAETPEPLSTRIDIDAARVAGRGQWTRHVLAPVVAGVAVAALGVAGMLVAIPRTFSSGAEPAGQAVASQSSAQRQARPSGAPALFNPLVPYAGFGPLPSGFSEQSAPQLKGGSYTTLTRVVRTAVQPSTGRELVLTVSSTKACQGVTVHSGKLPTPPAAADCAFSGYGVTGKAPAVNGRPAYWVNFDTLAWEYAPGGWAMLSPQAGAARPAGVKGWVARSVPSGGQGDVKLAIAAANPGPAVKDGLVIPPSAATLTLLEKVASQVRFGQEQPLVFPFRYSGEMPRGLRVTMATFTASGRRLIGVSVSVSVGQGTSTSPLWISTSATGASGCTFEPGDSVIRELGTSWVKQVEHYGSSGAQESLCSVKPSSLTAGLSVAISASTDSLSAGAVLAQLRFLGMSPSGWTARPFP
jgi:hypothetical protein